MLEILPQTQGSNIAYKVSGFVSESDYEAMLPEFERRIQKSIRFRLLLDWEHLEGWEPEAGPTRFGVLFLHRWRCERLAIVADSSDRTVDISAFEALFPRSFEIHIFPIIERDAAWQWLTND